MISIDERKEASRRYNISDIIRRRIVIVLIALAVIASIGVSAYQYMKYGVYNSIDISAIPAADADNYEWFIDELESKNGQVYNAEGWVIRKGEDISTYNISLVIVNEDGSAYAVPTERKERADITEFYGSEFNYDSAGFVSTINTRYIIPQESRLYLLYQNNDRCELLDLDITL